MKKSCHGRHLGDIFHITYLSYGLILYCETSMLEDSNETETKRQLSQKPTFIRIRVAPDFALVNAFNLVLFFCIRFIYGLKKNFGINFDS